MGFGGEGSSLRDVELCIFTYSTDPHLQVQKMHHGRMKHKTLLNMALGSSGRLTEWLNRAYSEEQLSWRGGVDDGEPEQRVVLPFHYRVCFHPTPACTGWSARKGCTKALQ